MFLRTVGGFSGLRAVLGVMHATSQQHFWICGLHAPSFWYLSRLQASVNLTVFRTTIHMPRVGARELGDWLDARCVEASARPSFSRLVTRSPLGGDPERALQRARDAYWRLLTDTAQGNPRIAFRYWLDSLRVGEAADGEVVVTMFKAPAPSDLTDARDMDLFVLTAILVHDGVTVTEQARILNLPEGMCRSSCRAMEARGVLEWSGENEQYRVVPEWQPAVERLLRQKYFLHVA
jgi:hypothetical protein